MRVNATEYPKSLSWEMKSFSMPNIPRGTLGMKENLKTILEMVRNNISPSQRLIIEGSECKIDLGTACVRLRPMKLLLKTQTGWVLSDEAQRWLDTDDDLYLAAFLCARIKFLAEVLYYLDEPKTAAELQNIAINEYALTWKTTSDINARLVWLRQLGLVEFQDFSLLYFLTDLGREFVSNIEIVESIKQDFSFDETLNEGEVEVSEWALTFCSNLSGERKSSIGYIVGDMKQFQTTIAEFIQLINGGKSVDQVMEYVKENYAIASSSLRSFFSTLTNMGILERKTATIYDVTDTARLWSEKRQIVDLICIMHRQFDFMFEMLGILEERSMSNKELAAIAKVSYGFERENIDEIRRRVAIFQAAKLIRNDSIDKYTITSRGRKLLGLIKLEKPVLAEAKEKCGIEDENTQDSHFFTELRLAAKDSGNFERLEKNVKVAFEKLGFEAQWLGGAGKTDVLVRAAGNSMTTYSVTIDAKSTLSGNVTDNLVNFDTLEEHRRKHKADFSAVVGGSFQNERLIKRAIEHNVVLIDIDTLETLIRNHLEVPIQVTSYKKLFESPGIANVKCLEEEREKITRHGNLLHAVMDCLVAEREDEVTGGILQERDIYRSLRMNESFSAAPNIDEISAMLQFLASPLIGCVEKSKEGYLAVGTLDDAAQKFDFYSRMCRNSK
ncbi:hypothetical protein [Parablautia intestinalis]|uniref:hypothetical protein n=1 Tax=Parablautia intestinalis TaxID=2320100 RepID=UPI00259CDD82|nr:hypothetical protein [Parablautia intestinalis]